MPDPNDTPTTTQKKKQNLRKDIALNKRLERMKKGDYFMVGEPLEADTVSTKGMDRQKMKKKIMNSKR